MSNADDHRDSTRDDLGIENHRLADDLLIDAILAGRAHDRPEEIKQRVRDALGAIDAPLATIGPASRSARRTWWSVATAAAVLLISAGLFTALVTNPTPAYAMVEASFDRLESQDLTFRFTVESDASTPDQGDRQRRNAQRRPGIDRKMIERKLDGATLHVRGDQAVMLVSGRGGEVLARGHRDGRFWSNHLPEHIETAVAERGGNFGGIPFQKFLDLIDGDVPSLLGDLRKGFTLDERGPVTDEFDGSTNRHITGVRRDRTRNRGNRIDRPEPRRGSVERFDLWIDENGDLQRLRLEGLQMPGSSPLGAIVLELVGTDPLDDEVFDPETYPEIRRPKAPRGDQRPSLPPSDERRRRAPRD